MKPIGAITGRVASSEPNLQNIPARSSFRGCFRAPPGRVIVTADYSAAELRILAEMSRDPVFLRTFADRGDLHAIVAAQVFGRPVSKTENPELRARAKAINFGLAYGMGAQGLAAQIGASVDEAERLLERYFRAFPAIRGHLERSARDALERGFAETLAGRRFWFQDQLTDGVDEGTRLRVAKNMPIQGTNADMTKLAMGRIARAVAQDGLDAAIVNMVHDELVLECEASVKDRVVAVVEREMIAAGAELLPNVPIEVETHVGEAWLK
jgi:DNA polymerase-1